MALRQIRTVGDPCLTKVCKEVEEVNERTLTLIDDMLDTMYEAEGVGLAAPQVGVLKRIVVIDVGEGPIVMINPEILETSGSQTGSEGCLSVPGKAGTVTRPDYVKAKAYDEEMGIDHPSQALHGQVEIRGLRVPDVTAVLYVKERTGKRGVQRHQGGGEDRTSA